MFRSALLLSLFFGACQGQVDKTRVPKAVGAAVVDAVVDMIREVCVFSDDARFLRRIAYAATKDGQADHTFKRNGVDYDGGIWQVDEAVFEETKQATRFFADIESNFHIRWADVQWSDLQKPLYCGLASRIAIEQKTNGIVPRAIAEQAVIWAEHLQTISRDHQAIEEQYNDLTGSFHSNSNGEVPRADLVFVLDSSGSVSSVNFELMKNFVVRVVQHFSNPSSIGVRVAVITYSTGTVIEFDLEEHDNKAEIIQAIHDITYQNGGTNSADALLTMKNLFGAQGRGTDGVPEIGIFMTDGASNNRSATAQAADEVHAAKVTVFSIGITDGVNKDEIERIGSDPDCVHVYYLTTFTDVTHFAEEIEDLASKAPAVLNTGEEVVDEVFAGGMYHFKTNVSKEEGATVMVNVTEGGVEVFLSYAVRNPSDVVHSYSFKVLRSDGIRGLYIPHPSLEEWLIASRAGNDSVELFGTVVGLNGTTKNSYTVTVADGHEVFDNYAHRVVGNAVAVLMSILIGVLLSKM